METVTLGEAPDPAALDLLGQRIEAAGDIVGGGVCGDDVAGYLRREHPGNGGLLDHLAIIAAVQAAQHVADYARVLDQGVQVATRALLAGGELEHAIVEPGV